MKKKIYVAPVAELVVFMPTEEIADSTWQWNWGTFNGPASITGNIPLITDDNSWKYDSKDPY